ncbi:PfkB family carbohydrate kinase [Naasia sp. SYSU D00948]|uniref:PfkB family carbohydrate kinase n=1 Tax=Naasia sp. SYSU D00948 TaxID=2817379 RepID=UPI001B30FED0|nr:PfkB family carbohydrate kinase [Naasia sp. SYSU D00948]
MGRVVVVGSLNVDSVVTVERHPKPGETVLGGDLRTLWGGKGANQAVAAARAGAAVTMVGRVGDDAFGGRYVDRLRELGIDVTGVRVDPDGVTGHAAIAVAADGENTIIVSPGANGRVTVQDLAPVDALGDGDVLLAQLELDLGVVADAARRAARAGARVVLNLAPYADLPADVLALADPVVVNEHEGELLERAGLRPPSLLTTLGGDGARWGDLSVPAAPVERVVDTTGAGDAFCGALAAALAAGADREEALRAAAAAGAEAVGWVGAQPA